MSRALCLAAALTACSGDTFVVKFEGGISFEGSISIGPDANDAAEQPDSGLDAHADADAKQFDAQPDNDAGCATVFGQTGCDQIMGAFCQRLYTCNGAMTVQQCKTWWAQNYPNEYDCAANKFKKWVCANDANVCANVEIPNHTCGKLMSSTPLQLAGACGYYFGEF